MRAGAKVGAAAQSDGVMNKSINRQKVVIIGAGMGGLAASIVCAHAGMDVLVVEKERAVGGKMRQIDVVGDTVDAGPTVFTMKWVFDRLLSPMGIALEDHINLHQAHLLARHFWPGGASLDLFADIDASAASIGDFAGARNAKGYRRFCTDSAAIFDTLKETYIAGERPGPLDLVARIGFANLGKMAGLKPLSTLWSSLGHYFDDPRLRQLFGRYATYCGSSPFSCPATLQLVAHVEQDGVWLPQGGMHGLALTIQRIAQNMGVRFQFANGVDRIVHDGTSVRGVVLSTGEEIPAHAIVYNGDASALGLGNLGDLDCLGIKPVKSRRRSLSAMVWTATSANLDLALAHHSVAFSEHYKPEFDSIFAKAQTPSEPTVYVCAQDRDDFGALNAAARKNGRERLLILTNAPATGDTHTFQHDEVKQCQHAMERQLARCGIELKIEPARSKLTTPSDFEKLFPASGGALYGMASHGWMASFQRQGARTKLKGLYLAGGSVHPGPGVPMAALSGQIAAANLVLDLASTRSSHRAATFGGMSTA